jgi:hypothetical protein
MLTWSEVRACSYFLPASSVARCVAWQHEIVRALLEHQATR